MMVWILGLAVASGMGQLSPGGGNAPETPPVTGVGNNNANLPLARPPQTAPPAPGQPTPAPPPTSASPGSETEARDLMAIPPVGRPYEAESSARELQPGAGEFFIPPPPIPSAPPSMNATAEAEANAYSRQPLTLEAVEELAARYNGPLKQARAQVEVEFGMAIQAGLWPNPTLSYVQSGITPTVGTPSMVVTQTIPTAGRKRIDRARWLEATKASQWDAVAVEYRVLNDVRRYYFHTLALQAMVEVQKDLVKNSEDMLVSAREGYNLGFNNLQTIHHDIAGLQEQRLSYLKMQNQYRMVWQQLMASIGVQMPFTPLAGGLEGDTTPVEWDATLDRLFRYSPSMQAAYANLRFEQLTLKWQRVQAWPNIQITGQEGYNFSAGHPTTTAQVHLVGVPIWNWNQGYIRRANAHVLRQQAEIKRVQQQLQLDAAQVYEAYLTALQYVESYQKIILPELRRNYELALDSYEDDRTTWGIVLGAQRTYFSARQTYISHLATWRMNEVLLVGFLYSGATAVAPSGLPPGHPLTGIPAPAAASQFVSPGQFLLSP